MNSTRTAAVAAAKLLQSCPTLCDPIDRQPNRLHRPWDSPGKSTGVGCHFLLQCMKVKSEREVTQSYPTLSDPMDCSLPGSSIHGIFQARVLKWGAISFSTTLLKINYSGPVHHVWLSTKNDKAYEKAKNNSLKRQSKYQNQTWN